MTKGKGSLRVLAGISIVFLSAGLFSPSALAGVDESERRQKVIDHWTPERRAAAQPRDMVIDHRGLGYIRRADGSLQPHGHQISAEKAGAPTPNARPGGNDGIAPVVGAMDPNGTTIGASYTFSATVTDNVGLKSVTFVIVYPGGSQTQSFTASNSGGDTWTVSLQGFSDGAWGWYVVAKDTATKGGNTTTSATVPFTVDTSGGGGGGGGGGDGDTITNAHWTGGGDVQYAVGRIFFQMPANSRRKGPWNGYVCSGTVVNDTAVDGRSIILTAAHCVYDDANKAFARNVLFIPDQDGTDGSGTDSNCGNDPIGCWVANFGVVDTNWTTRTFPDNIPWDYAYYVVSDTGAHEPGLDLNADDVLDGADVNELDISFGGPDVDDGTAGATTPDFTHAMGYSYSEDPNFMYCAEDMTTEGSDNWWLPSCGLSGGSSGGPWVQPLNGGTGPIISVNSWGYNGSPGMAGPILDNTVTSAECVFASANSESLQSNWTAGDAGYDVTCN